MKILATILLGLITLTFSEVWSQVKTKVDSLHRVLEGPDTCAKARVLYELSFQYLERDRKKALDYIERAEQAAYYAKDSLYMAKSKRVKGQILYLFERYDDALEVLSEAAYFAQGLGNRREYWEATSFVGLICTMMGRYDRALSIAFRRLTHLKEQNDGGLNLSRTLIHIGLVYYKLKDYVKALEYWEQALSHLQLDSADRQTVYINMALACISLNRLDDAREFIRIAASICRRAPCADINRVNASYARGRLAWAEDRGSDARRHHRQSMAIATKIGDTRFQMDNSNALAHIYLAVGNVDSLKSVLGRIEELVSNNPPFRLELMKVHSQLYEFYMLMNDPLKASLHQKRYSDLRDSLYSLATLNRLIHVNVEEVEKQYQERLTVTNELIDAKEKLLSRQRILTASLTALACTFGGFLWVLYRSWKRGRRIGAILEDRVKDRTRELLNQREKSARELWETKLCVKRTYNRLRAITMQIEGLCNVMAKTATDSSIKECIDEIRTQSKVMRVEANILATISSAEEGDSIDRC